MLLFLVILFHGFKFHVHAYMFVIHHTKQLIYCFFLSLVNQTIDANGDLSSMFKKYREQEDFIIGRKAASSWQQSAFLMQCLNQL